MQLVSHDPQVATAQMQTLVAMVRSLAERVYELSALSVSARLQHYLLKHAQPLPNNQAVIEPKPTHAEISAFITAQRPVITKELGRLEQAGLIQQQSQKLLITDYNMLCILVNGDA